MKTPIEYVDNAINLLEEDLRDFVCRLVNNDLYGVDMPYSEQADKRITRINKILKVMKGTKCQK